jgi:hypothetical protein
MRKPAMKAPTTSRRMRGFEPASGLLRERLRRVGEARGFAVARLLTHWAEVVGSEIAAQTLPVKVGYGKGGLGATLTLLTTGPAAPMVQMQLPRIREKVNACYGYNAIARIVLTQTAPIGFEEGQAQFSPAPKLAPEVDPLILREAEASAADVGDANLRAALAKLAENVLSRCARSSAETRSEIKKG